MSEILFLVEQAPEGGYQQGRWASLFLLRQILCQSCAKWCMDAVHCHFDEKDMPKAIRLHIVQEEMLAA